MMMVADAGVGEVHEVIEEVRKAPDVSVWGQWALMKKMVKVRRGQLSNDDQTITWETLGSMKGVRFPPWSDVEGNIGYDQVIAGLSQGSREKVGRKRSWHGGWMEMRLWEDKSRSRFTLKQEGEFSGFRILWACCFFFKGDCVASFDSHVIISYIFEYNLSIQDSSLNSTHFHI